MGRRVCNSDLFIPLKTAIKMIREGINSQPTNLAPLLLNNLDTYLYVSGLFEYYLENNSIQKKELTHISGLCLASMDMPPSDIYPDNYSGHISLEQIACNLYATHYTGLDMSEFKSETVSLMCVDGQNFSNQYLSNNALLKGKDLYEFFKKTKIPISMFTFVRYFLESYKTEVFYLFGKYYCNDQDLKDIFNFKELCETFGKEHLDDIEKSVPKTIEVFKTLQKEEDEKSDLKKQTAAEQTIDLESDIDLSINEQVQMGEYLENAENSLIKKDIRREQSQLCTISILLEMLLEKTSKNQSYVVQSIIEQYPNTYGLSQSAIEKRFAESKKALQELKKSQ